MVAEYGNLYASFLVIPALIKHGGIALCAGVGLDISFDLELINQHDMRIIAIDPTDKAARFIEKNKPKNYWYIQKALVGEHANQTITIHPNRNDMHVSESIFSSHHAVDNSIAREVPTIKLSHLKEVFGKFDLIKLDIEGAEYDLIEYLPLFEPKIICIEFHHGMTNYTQKDTEAAEKYLSQYNYTVIMREGANELTFFRL
jgi:FkbM family methyltransferase